MKHITFASENMSISAGLCKASALRFGCKESKIYTPSDLDYDFVKSNYKILKQPRGAGYWLWKPYIILKRLQELENGEMLIYTDAGVEFENDVSLMVKEMNHDIMVFGNRWRHGDWCKMDVLKGMDCSEFADREQLQASCFIIRNGAYSKSVISNWLTTAMLPGYIDDSESVLPNPTGWREHRHDQAIISNIVFKMNIPVHWWPAQYNVRYKHKYTNQYPVMFKHHRLRNDQY